MDPIEQQAERLQRLQNALFEAYPDLYKRHSYSINDYESLALSSINECEVICQLLLDIEEGRTNQEEKQSEFTHEKKVQFNQYSELIKKLEQENEFQQNLIEKLSHQITLLKQLPVSSNLLRGGKVVPGNKLQQRLSGVQTQANLHGQNAGEMQAIEREIKQLRAQYSGKKRAISLDQERRDVGLMRTLPSGNDRLSQERLPKFIGEQNRSQTIAHPLTDKTLTLSTLNKPEVPIPDSRTLQSMTKHQLIVELTKLKQAFQEPSNLKALSDPKFLNRSQEFPIRPHSTTTKHTSYRFNLKQSNQLQQEMKDLEKRHLLIVKDFHKLQDERQKVLRERDDMLIQVNVLENSLEEITTKMTSLVQVLNKVDDIQPLVNKLEALQEKNKEQLHQIQDFEFQLVEKNQLITQLKSSEQKLLHQLEEQKALKIEQTELDKEGLIFDYGLVRSPRYERNVTNKAVQCDDLPGVKGQNYLVDKYDSLREECTSLKQDYQSVQEVHCDQKFKIKGLISSIAYLKAVIQKQILGRKNVEEEVLGEEIEDISFYEEIIKQVVKVIESQGNDEAGEIDKKQAKNFGRYLSKQLAKSISQAVSSIEELYTVKQTPETSKTISDYLTSLGQVISELAQQFVDLSDIKPSQLMTLPSLDQYSKILNQFVLLLAKFKQNEESYSKQNPLACPLSNESIKHQLQQNQHSLSKHLKQKKQLLQNNQENLTSNNPRSSSLYKSISSPIQARNSEEQIGQTSQTKPFQMVSESFSNIQTMSPFKNDPSMSNQMVTLSQNQFGNGKSLNGQQQTDKKMNYMNLKLKELEKNLEKTQDDFKEKAFLLQTSQEEVERKNQQLENLKSLIEEMNMKLNHQNEYIQKLEKANKDTVIQYQVEAQKHKREHEKIIQGMKNWKERETEDHNQLSDRSNQPTRNQNEQIEKNLILLKGQYEREKRLVDDKVRELTLLQSGSVSEKELRRENLDLKHLNSELNAIIKEERGLYETQKEQFNEQIAMLKQKISNIEFGCAHQIVLALRNLREEIDQKTNSKRNESVNYDENVDQIIKDISVKVGQLIKQRESLQKAVNLVQSEKQQMMLMQSQQFNQVNQSMGRAFQGPISQSHQFQRQPSSSYFGQPTPQYQQFAQASQFNGAPGNISRIMNPLDNSLPQIIQSQSPNKNYGQQQQYYNQISSQTTLPPYSKSVNNLNKFSGHPDQQEIQSQENQSNLLEYLQAEVMAGREKKDQLMQKNQSLQKQIVCLESRVVYLDIFSKKENVETYQSLLSSVRDVLNYFNQAQLLDDIISEPLKQKQKPKKKGRQEVNESGDNSTLLADESMIIFQENSMKLLTDLEALLPLFGKCLCMLLLDKDKLTDKLREMERMQHETLVQRNEELEVLAQREVNDKSLIKQLETNYKHELEYLRVEKDILVQKTKDFAKNLIMLQKDNVSKKETISILKSELKQIKDESKDIEDKLRREMSDKYERDVEQRLSKVRDENYFRGRKEGSDEMTVENMKLREIIDSLRQEASMKGKRLTEVQFELDEMVRSKKKNAGEVDELYQKLSKEREGQKELQQRLDGLLSEVSYLKNISRQMHSQQN